MLSELLEGKTPSVQDILFVQSCVLESLDLYAPVDLGRQLQGAGMDVSGREGAWVGSVHVCSGRRACAICKSRPVLVVACRRTWACRC